MLLRPPISVVRPPPSTSSSTWKPAAPLTLTLALITLLLLPSVHAMRSRVAVTAEGRKLFGGYRIVPQPCKSQTEARHGVCMFNYECVQRAGDVIGACMDGFLFGACCQLPPGSLLPSEAALHPVKDAIPAPSTVGMVNEVMTVVTSSTEKPTKGSTQRVTTATSSGHVHTFITKLPLKPHSNHPTPPSFKPVWGTPTSRPTMIAEENIENTASISHILNLLNDSASFSDPIPDRDHIFPTDRPDHYPPPHKDHIFPTDRPEPALSTWVSVNGQPTHHSVTTQKYPTTVTIGAQGPGFMVTMNSAFKPATPRPTPSAPAPTLIVLGPLHQGEVPTTDVISRPPGSVEAVEAEDEEVEFTTPSFEDAELGNKVHVFVNKIVNSLAGDFQNLEDVVLNNKNLTISAPTTQSPVTATPTKKPTRKPATSTSTAKPTRKPTSAPTTAFSPVTAAVEDEIDSDYRSACGIRPLVKKNGRIVGGKGASFGEWPWQVLVRESTWLGLFTKNKCGGVLITNKYVITAAHCQPGFLASLVAVFGELDLSNEQEARRAIVKNVRRVIVHRLYEPSTFENDIALLELESPVTFDEHIVPICLPDDRADFTGRVATVSGWGRLKYAGGVPSVLQMVKVPVMENSVCQEMFHTAGNPKTILPSFLCAGYANGQRDSCEGDSGGPLMVENGGRWVLVGTVSHGIKCAAPYLPGVYMRTTFYKPWLKTITGAS